jgi:hypothetical protein
MTKEAPTSVKMECDMRDEFRAPANERNCPSTYNEIPNTLTAKAIAKSRKGEGVFNATSSSKLYKQLGI